MFNLYDIMADRSNCNAHHQAIEDKLKHQRNVVEPMKNSQYRRRQHVYWFARQHTTRATATARKKAITKWAETTGNVEKLKATVVVVKTTPTPSESTSVPARASQLFFVPVMSKRSPKDTAPSPSERQAKKPRGRQTGGTSVEPTSSLSHDVTSTSASSGTATAPSALLPSLSYIVSPAACSAATSHVETGIAREIEKLKGVADEGQKQLNIANRELLEMEEDNKLRKNKMECAGAHLGSLWLDLQNSMKSQWELNKAALSTMETSGTEAGVHLLLDAALDSETHTCNALMRHCHALLCFSSISNLPLRALVGIAQAVDDGDMLTFCKACYTFKLALILANPVMRALPVNRNSIALLFVDIPFYRGHTELASCRVPHNESEIEFKLQLRLSAEKATSSFSLEATVLVGSAPIWFRVSSVFGHRSAPTVVSPGQSKSTRILTQVFVAFELGIELKGISRIPVNTTLNGRKLFFPSLTLVGTCSDSLFLILVKI
ncbi:hypothetical protein Pelo_7603 [Pelomyxa schiedti]|nr:hypothetical protein Pelo_7603 [Pelomyxa schiedti]